MVEAREVKGYVPAHGVTTIFYLVRKQVGVDEARNIVGLLLHVFRVAPVTQRDPKGFVGSLVRVVEPEVAVATLVRRATTRT